MEIEKMGFKQIIEKIFLELEYERINDNNEISIYFNNRLKHYYIVTDKMELLNIDFEFENYQSEIFESTVDWVQDKGFLKNSSWVIGTSLHDISDLNKILPIEENEYYFRKYVLWYSEDEINKFYQEFSESTNILNTLNTMLFDYSRYVNWYKKKDDEVYDFVSRLFIKIPTINLNDLKKKKEIDILKNIKDCLANENNQNILTILEDNMEKIIQYNTDNNLNELLPMLQRLIGDANEQ